MTGPRRLLVLDLVSSDAAHLRRALMAHQRWCVDAGYRLPETLAALLAATAASAGQERTDQDAAALPVDDPGVALALNYADAGRLLDVSERTVRRLVATGELPHVEIGGNRRVLREDLVTYLERHRTSTAGVR